MHLFPRLIARFVINIILLYAANQYLAGFSIVGGPQTLFGAALVITIINTFLKPILRFITAPLVWLSLGLFLIVINVAMLWLADILLPSISFTNYYALIILSIIIGFANSML